MTTDQEAVITRVYERHGCLYVEGRVLTNRGALKAAFTVPKQEIAHMTGDEFRAFAIRRLPDVTEDKDWREFVH